jgi:sugar phosphate isomerase/epimerase
MSRMLWGGILLGLLGVFAQPAPAPSTSWPGPTNLLVFRDAEGRPQPVRSLADRDRRRQDLLLRMQQVMGPLPESWRNLPLELRVLEEVRLPTLTRKKIAYRADPDDFVSAYLLIPHECPGKAPAVLCLHQTVESGKDEPAGLGGSPDLHYAQELAERGYVTLSPDYWTFGDYRTRDYDPYQHGYVSGTMKGIWNHIRSLDVLQALPEVDGARLGCIGHSLGGHNALWLAAFDPRVKAVVSSCGFSSFGSYAASPYGGGDLKNYAQRRYMPRMASQYGSTPNRVPFDWPEVLASLAPRPVFVNAPVRDENFIVSGVDECIAAARPVYGWMGSPDHLVVLHPEVGHSFPPEIRQAAYRFIDTALRPEVSPRESDVTGASSTKRGVRDDGTESAEPPSALACRLANYQEFAELAWTHLPSIGIRHVFLNAPPPDQIEATRKRLKEHGLTAVVLRGDADLSLASGLDRLAEQLATCETMGVRYLFLSVKRREVDKPVIYERLRKAGDLARKHGVVIALETHPDLGTNGDVQRETMRQVNHPNVRINFDTGNIHFYNRGTDAPTELRKIIDYVATVEVKDHNGEFESWHFPALGKGVVNFPAVLQLLREHGYRGPITLEIEGVQGVPRNREDVLRDIEDSMAYLRSLGSFQ